MLGIMLNRVFGEKARMPIQLLVVTSLVLMLLGIVLLVVPRADAQAASNARAPDATAGPFTTAIFVRNRERRIDEHAVVMLEDYLKAALNDSCFTTKSSDATTPIENLDKLLSDNASALSLAESMDVDFVLIASISALRIDARKRNDAAGSVLTDVVSYRLDATYRILGRLEGRVVASGSASVADSFRQAPGLAEDGDLIDTVLRASADKMATAMKKRCERAALPTPA